MKARTLIQLCFCILLFGCSTTSKYQAGDFIPYEDQIDSIPFTYAQGLIVVKASINGIEGNFMVDNGFSISAVDDDFAKKANISFNKKATTSDANNRKSTSLETIINEIKIGKQVFSRTAFWQVFTENFLPCDSIDGVIGASIINKANWQIDFESKILKCSPTPFNEQGFKMGFIISSNNSTYIKLEVEGKKFNCKVDLGKTQEIELNSKDSKNLFKNFLVEEKVGIMSLSAHGLGNEETTYKLKDKISVFHSGKQLPVSGKVLISKKLKNQGYIGVNYFKNYLLSINSKSREYILSLRPKSLKEEKIKSYGVAIYLIGGKWKLIQKHPNEERSTGLKLMWEIIEIDDKPISDFKTICDYKEYLAIKKEKEEELRLKFSNGKKETFPFKELKYIEYLK